MDAHLLLRRGLERLGALATHPRGPRVVSAVLVAALGWQLADLTWKLLPAPTTGLAEHGDASVPGLRADDGEAAAMRLARMHVFGQPLVQTHEPAVTEAPETQLDLTLKGLFVAGADGGSAIIAVGSGSEEVYTVGDTLVGRTRVAAIRAEGVIIERDGAPELLRMDGAPPPRARGAGGGNSRTRATTARRLRQHFIENPASLARNVRFQPAVRGGELIGYRLASRSTEIPLGELGLRPSDIVTQVNGVPLNDPRRASEVLTSLRDAASIDVSLLRNGASHSLSIPIGAPG